MLSQLQMMVLFLLYSFQNSCKSGYFEDLFGCAMLPGYSLKKKQKKNKKQKNKKKQKTKKTKKTAFLTKHHLFSLIFDFKVPKSTKKLISAVSGRPSLRVRTLN